MAYILFSHGDKGGVGKSIISSIVIDYCIEHDRPVALIEGDRRQPDVALRYSDYIPTSGISLNRPDTREQAALLFEETLKEIADNNDTVVVVNLPASASETLDEIADVFVGSAQASGHTCSVIYSVGPHSTATDGIRISAQSGLVGAAKPNICVAYNAFLGDPAKFDYVTSGMREKIGNDFHEITLPDLKPPELAQKTFATKRPLSQLVQLDCGDLTVTERMLFQRNFLYPAHEAIASFLPNGVADE